MGTATDNASVSYPSEEHALHIAERTALIEAARESARTFDQAVLAFGSAIFAASIAFLKDVAPHTMLYSLKWLGCSWSLFAIGLLFLMLSFLFSHKACMRGIDISDLTSTRVSIFDSPFAAHRDTMKLCLLPRNGLYSTIHVKTGRWLMLSFPVVQCL